MGIKENIKSLRLKHGLSQKELADIAGVSDKAVSTWELGTNEPRMGAIQKIADHFGILKSDIIEDVNSRPYYLNPEAAKMAQEIRPFLKINDSFKKIVITSNTPKPFYNDQGILIMNVYDFLLNVESLKL